MKKIFALAGSVALVMGLVACSHVVSNPYNAEDEISVTSSDSEEVIESSEEAVEDSSSSAKEESSSDKTPSSSAKDEDESSSSEDESSSSEDESSSSEAVEDSSSSKDESSSATIPDKVGAKDTVITLTPDQRDSIMNPLDSTKIPVDPSQLDSLKGDDLVTGKDELDFGKNEYLCLSPEGNWYVLEGSKYNSWIAKVWNWIYKFFTGESWFDYSEVCDVIYVRPKNQRN